MRVLSGEWGGDVRWRRRRFKRRRASERRLVAEFVYAPLTPAWLGFRDYLVELDLQMLQAVINNDLVEWLRSRDGGST